MAIELVADRATKAPFDPGLKVSARVKAEAFARGLLVYPGAGTVDGVRGDHVLLAPPYIVSDGEIDVIVERLGAAVDAAVAGVRGGAGLGGGAGAGGGAAASAGVAGPGAA
jgi:adenosylmethionine-8-amino-7-oxononanoate aminotransferase